MIMPTFNTKASDSSDKSDKSDKSKDGESTTVTVAPVSDPHAYGSSSTTLLQPQPFRAPESSHLYAYPPERSRDVQPPRAPVPQLITRTPSPTPSEAELLALRDFYDYNRLKNWRWWVRPKMIIRYIIIATVITFAVLLSVFDTQIIKWINPFGQKLRSMEFGWLIPVAILFVLSFPPLFGQEIVAIFVGVIYGLGRGFAIVAVGEFLGEVANFYFFKHLCAARAQKLEDNDVQYACFTHIIRHGGWKVATIARWSILPPHFVTAVFATSGMTFLSFVIANVLSLPRQLIKVYVGVALEQAGLNKHKSKANAIQNGVIAAVFVVSFVALAYIRHKMVAVKPHVIYARRKARQAKLLQALQTSDTQAKTTMVATG